jgi:hypothetical protein
MNTKREKRTSQDGYYPKIDIKAPNTISDRRYHNGNDHDILLRLPFYYCCKQRYLVWHIIHR